MKPGGRIALAFVGTFLVGCVRWGDMLDAGERVVSAIAMMMLACLAIMVVVVALAEENP